jgi:hypothetical protein
MAVKIDPKVNCRHCSAKMEARMMAAARMAWGDLESIVFAHTLPVFICPTCDTAPQRRKDRLTLDG